MTGLGAWQVWCLAAVCLARAIAASAQTPAPNGGRAELDVGVTWIGTGAFNPANANLTAPNGSPFVLFSTSNDIGSSLGTEMRLAFRVTRRLRAEMSGAWSHADLRSRISGDSEGADAVTSTLRISVFSVEGSAIWAFPRRGKLEIFVRGGAGWTRELTSDNVLSADGAMASGGAGVKYWWRERDRGVLNHVGLRSEFGLVTRSGGLLLGTRRRLMTPGATAGVVVGF